MAAFKSPATSLFVYIVLVQFSSVGLSVDIDYLPKPFNLIEASRPGTYFVEILSTSFIDLERVIWAIAVNLIEL